MYKPIDKDVVLRLVREKGPVIPIHLRKELDTDTVLIGAMFSQLIAEGKVKVTTVKIGGSPFYYTPGTEEKLVNCMRYLNEKDRRVAEMLQSKKVMKDIDQDPLVRVCLRNIKDYSKPLEVNVKGQKEIYWKWYLTPTKEAEEIILGVLKPKKAEKPIIKEEEAPQKKLVAESKAEQKKDEASAQKEAKPKKERKKSEEKKAAAAETSEKKPAEAKPTEKHEYQRHLGGVHSSLLDEEKDPFFNAVRKYLDEKEISILDYKILKRAEIDLFILVPTKLGVQEYFCKAKNKKKVSDGDLSSAYQQGSATKLPIIFLSPGEMSKKAKDALAQLKGMSVKKL